MLHDMCACAAFFSLATIVSYVEVLHPDLNIDADNPYRLQSRTDSKLAAGFAIFVVAFCLSVVGTFISAFAAWRESRLTDMKWCKSAAHWLNIVLTSSLATVLLAVALASSSWEQLDSGNDFATFVVDMGLFKLCLVSVLSFMMYVAESKVIQDTIQDFGRSQRCSDVDQQFGLLPSNLRASFQACRVFGIAGAISAGATTFVAAVELIRALAQSRNRPVALTHVPVVLASFAST